MNFILTPNNFNTWIDPAINKILKTISSCTNEDHIKAAKNMIDNFVLIMAIKDTKTETLEETINLFWLMIKLQSQIIKNKETLNC